MRVSHILSIQMVMRMNQKQHSTANLKEDTK